VDRRDRVAGVTLSYVYGIAAGGSIVVAVIAVYAVVLIVRKLPADAPRRALKPSNRRRTGRSRDVLEADGGDEQQ